MPAAGGCGVKGWCSSMPPWPTVTADDCGISCQAPGRSANGSETITRSSFVSGATRGFSGYSRRTDSTSAEANSDRAGPSVAYRAAHSYLALRLLGYPAVRNYLGSWKEWGDRHDLPIETPGR